MLDTLGLSALRVILVLVSAAAIGAGVATFRSGSAVVRVTDYRSLETRWRPTVWFVSALLVAIGALGLWRSVAGSWTH